MERQRAIRPVRVVGDLLLLATIPAGLAAVHVLVPAAGREAVVLDPAHPTALSLFAAAFVHLDTAHLVGNLGGYAVGAGYAYLLALLADERRWFWFSVVIIVLGLPALVNGTWVGMVRVMYPTLSLPVRGFSGVVAGFGGLLYVSLWVAIRKRRSRATAMDVGYLGILGLLAALEVLYDEDTLGPVLALLGVGVALSAGRLLRRGLDAAVLRTASGRWGILQDVGLVAIAGLALAVMVLGLFPSQLAEDGVVTNVFAHFIGFLYGAVIARWGFRYWRRQALMD